MSILQEPYSSQRFEQMRQRLEHAMYLNAMRRAIHDDEHHEPYPWCEPDVTERIPFARKSRPAFRCAMHRDFYNIAVVTTNNEEGA